MDAYTVKDGLHVLRVWSGFDALLPECPDDRHRTILQVLNNVVESCESTIRMERLVVNVWGGVDQAHAYVLKDLLSDAVPSRRGREWTDSEDCYDANWNIHLGFSHTTSDVVSSFMANTGLVKDYRRARLTLHVRGGTGIEHWSMLRPLLFYMSPGRMGMLRIVVHIVEEDAGDTAAICEDLNRRLIAYSNDMVMNHALPVDTLSLVNSHLFICPHIMPDNCDNFPVFAGMLTREQIAAPEETRTIYGA